MRDNKIWHADDPWNILSFPKPRRVQFPLFNVSTNPVVPLTSIKEKRFDLIERAQNLCRDELQNSILFNETVWKADDPFVWKLLPLYTMNFGVVNKNGDLFNW